MSYTHKTWSIEICQYPTLEAAEAEIARCTTPYTSWASYCRDDRCRCWHIRARRFRTAKPRKGLR